jgi:hypothetical protein
MSFSITTCLSFLAFQPIGRANQAFDEAIVELDTMSEESYWEKSK